MKKILILTFLFGSAFSVFAQLVLSSTSQIVVASGSTLVVGEILNTSGTIKNLGTVNISGDVTNNSGGLFDADSDGTVNINGSSAQTISGAAAVHYYGTLVINNTSGDISVTGAEQQVHGDMTLTSGKLSIGDSDLTLASATTLTGGSATTYIVTSGTGQLKRTVGSDNVNFPVGNGAYNPITLNNTGTSDVYGVKAVEGKPSGFTGTTHIVNESWDVTEAVPGESNLTVTTQWNIGDETTPFDRTKSCVGFTTDGGTDVAWSTVADAGSAPYTRSTTGITSVGTFMVGDDYYGEMRMDLKVILAAAWNGTNMDKNLNTGTPNLIPLTDPYGVGVTVSDIPANAVDWVKIELRNSSSRSTVTNTYAKFVDVNGQVIEEDGTNMKVTGVSGTYYVAVKHRNHLGIVTSAIVELTGAPNVNFKSTQATAWQDGDISTNAAMDEVESGSAFGLWSGDANADGEVQYASGANSDQVTVLNAVGSTTPGNIISNTYTKNDVNMDGEVQYASGPNSDQVTILNVVGSTTPGNIYSAHLPE